MKDNCANKDVLNAKGWGFVRIVCAGFGYAQAMEKVGPASAKLDGLIAEQKMFDPEANSTELRVMMEVLAAPKKERPKNVDRIIGEIASKICEYFPTIGERESAVGQLVLSVIDNRGSFTFSLYKAIVAKIKQAV